MGTDKMSDDEYIKDQKECMKSYVIDGKDEAGRVIDKIFLKSDECVAYEAKDTSGISAMRFAAHGKTPERDKLFDERFAKVGPLYQKAVSILYKSWNPNEAKRRLAQALFAHTMGDDLGEDNQFNQLITYLDEGYTKVNTNKIIFALAHLVLLVITVCVIGIVAYKFKITFIDTNIIWCVVGSVIGGYLMTTIGSSKILFTPEDAKLRYLFYAFERNVISIFLGATAYCLSKSGLALSFLTQEDTSNIYMILLLGIISGYFHSFIPSLLFNAKDKLQANK